MGLASARLKPALHQEFFVGDRVRITGMGSELEGKEGRVGGIGTAHIVFQYIVILDEPLPPPEQWPGASWEGILVPGGCMEPLR